MADLTEEILKSLRIIDGKVDCIDKKVAVYEKSIKNCEKDRDTLFDRTNGMRNDITILKTQKKTREKSKNTIFDIVFRTITIICTIALVTMWGIKLAKGELM